MTGRITALLFLATAAGCTTNADGTSSFGAPGSTDWTLTASQATKVQFYIGQCEAFGYAPGSPELSECAANAYRDGENRASAEMTTALATGAASYAATRPVRLRTSCTTYGRQTNCY